VRALVVNNLNNNSNANGNNNLNNNTRFLRIAQAPRHMYNELCSYTNLLQAFKKAKKGKTKKHYVKTFQKQLKENLLNLQNELRFHTYQPKPLQTFILKDPKTRKISKSSFKDRIVHHALHTIIEPYFEKTFIHDSYANRKGKGTLKAIHRLNHFKRKVSKNNTKACFVLKADIKHYFPTIDHTILLYLIKKKVHDERVLWLISVILANHQTTLQGKGMPLGNLTSQFFANIYLHELDFFIKYTLKAKHYIRYVDDFVILHKEKNKLQTYKTKINTFLKHHLQLQLHTTKTRILHIRQGIPFLGLRIYQNHQLIQKKNLRKLKKKLAKLYTTHAQGTTTYDHLYDVHEGWNAHAKQANTYKLRTRILHTFASTFPGHISYKDINRYHKTFINHT
jgi:RNA-directed DNA polymerase